MATAAAAEGRIYPTHNVLARAGNPPAPVIFRYQALYRPDIYDDEPWIVIRERQEANGWIADRHVCTYETAEDAFRVLDDLNAPKEIGWNSDE